MKGEMENKCELREEEGEGPCGRRERGSETSWVDDKNLLNEEEECSAKSLEMFVLRKGKSQVNSGNLFYLFIFPRLALILGRRYRGKRPNVQGRSEEGLVNSLENQVRQKLR